MKLLPILSFLSVILCMNCATEPFTHYPKPESVPKLGQTNSGPAKIYILAGQSNASGAGAVSTLTDDEMASTPDAQIFLNGSASPSLCDIWTPLVIGDGGNESCIGPEKGFAATIPGPVYVIKFSASGTSMDTYWSSPSSIGFTNEAFPGYINLLTTIQNGLASANIKGGAHLAGLLWLQGESDATNFVAASNYGNRLANFITDLRNAVGEPNLPVAIAQIHSLPGWTYGNLVQEQQWDVMNVVPNVKVFETQDIIVPSDTNPHFEGPEQILIGQRFAQAIQSLTQD